MIRTIKTERTVEETVDVYLCDRCGLDADPGKKLYYGVGLQRTPYAEQVIEMSKGRYPPVEYTVTEPYIEKAFDYVELSHEGYVRVCDDCFGELFSLRGDR